MINYRHIPNLGILNNQSSKEEVLQALNKFKSFYRNYANVLPETYIFRARLGKSELVPNSFSELSYNPNPSIGRANPAEFPVFYGCTHPEFSKPIQMHTMEVAIRETSHLYRNPTIRNDIELGCVSRWRLTKQLKLFPMFNYDFGEQTDEMIVNTKNLFNENLRNLSPNPERDIEIIHWLSSLFAHRFNENDNSKYQITSMLAKNFFMENHDGIMYPTVQGSGTAINIALKASAADSLRLEYVARIAVFKKFNQINKLFLQQSQDIIDGEILSWYNCE